MGPMGSGRKIAPSYQQDSCNSQKGHKSYIPHPYTHFERVWVHTRTRTWSLIAISGTGIGRVYQSEKFAIYVRNTSQEGIKRTLWDIIRDRITGVSMGTLNRCSDQLNAAWEVLVKTMRCFWRPSGRQKPGYYWNFVKYTHLDAE